MLNGNVYLPGSQILLRDIGDEADSRGEGSTLICNTTQVNTNCCRGIDNQNGGTVGEWRYPNNTVVPRPSDTADFSRRGFTHQIRLVRAAGKPAGPPGVYTCRIPDGTSGEILSATITLVASKLTSSFFMLCLN